MLDNNLEQFFIID